MLRSLKSLERYVVRGQDGDSGSLVDFVVDNDVRAIRFLVVRTGGPRFLAGRRVLIALNALREVEWSQTQILVELSCDEIFNCPVEHQNGRDARHAKDLRGFNILGTDGAIGHVTDIIADDADWRMRYLVIATSSWGAGKTVLLALTSVTEIDWAEHKIHVRLSRAAIADSEPWSIGRVIDREYEERLHAYYARPTYWGSGAPTAAELAND